MGSKLRTKLALGKDDRLQKVAIGADRADPREVGTDVSPPVADRMTGVAGRLFTVEDELTPADVARREGRHELLEPGLLPGRVDVEPGVEPLGLFLDAGSVFRQVGLDRVDPQAGNGRRIRQGFDELQTQ